mgnify:CR=1 FL=1
MDDFFGETIGPRQAARFLRSPGRLANVLQEKAPGWDATPAQIICDIINVQRADTKALANAHGVDVEMKLMDESRAAELIAGVTDGDAVEIIEVFNELARKRNEILQEVLDKDQYRDFMRRKTSIMYTDDPDTWEADIDESDQNDLPEGVDDVGDVKEAFAETEQKDGAVGVQEGSAHE